MREKLEAELAKLRAEQAAIINVGQQAQAIVQQKERELLACGGAITVLEAMLANEPAAEPTDPPV